MIFRPDALPKVSAILPCGYGSKYVTVAIECFLRQNYAGSLELVIVDNNADGSTIEHLLPEFDTSNPDPFDPNYLSLRYMQCDRASVGGLRNMGSKIATGDVLISWDEDDWYSPDRIAEQVERLRVSRKSVTGWHNVLFWDTETNKGYKYHYSPDRNHPPYACGTSQCYTRDWWEKHPFPEDQAVEDFGFQQAALHHGQLDSCDADQLCVARAHKDSKCPPQFGHKQFPAIENTAFPPEFFAAIGSKSVQQNPPMAAQGASSCLIL
jgi:glycosyltransferase involved in cell wall biosynthesis